MQLVKNRQRQIMAQNFYANFADLEDLRRNVSLQFGATMAKRGGGRGLIATRSEQKDLRIGNPPNTGSYTSRKSDETGDWWAGGDCQ
jgi:hypothetical protein